MVGNDVVDIIEAKRASNWKRPRFLEKLFTLKEQQLIKNCEDSFLMVWRLWSMKEAAYKLYTQLNYGRFYKPNNFECEVNGINGAVIYNDFKCYVKTKITSDYIISEARLDDSKMTSGIVKFTQKDFKANSKFLKTKLLHLVAKIYCTEENLLMIKKNEFGVPFIKYGLRELNVSFTHHGNYGAYAMS